MRHPLLPMAWPSATAPLKHSIIRHRLDRAVLRCLPVGIDLRRINIHNLLGGAHNYAKRLVQFELSDILGFEARTLQGNWKGNRGCSWEIDRSDRSIGKSYNTQLDHMNLHLQILKVAYRQCAPGVGDRAPSPWSQM